MAESLPQQSSTLDADRVMGRKILEWRNGLRVTERGNYEGIVSRPDGMRGFYSKSKEGAFSFWPIGQGQQAGELADVLYEMGELERANNVVDSPRYQELVSKATELGKNKIVT